MHLRISLFAGPGAGKSTMAAAVYARLKTMHCNVELVQEYIKNWAYEDRPIKSFDQCYIFAKQMRSEDRLLQSGLEMIVSDSPMFLQCYYADKYNTEFAPELFSIANKFEQEYPAINIFLKRHHCEYQQKGRYETYEESLVVDAEIQKYLTSKNIPFVIAENEVEHIVVLILHRFKEMSSKSENSKM
jgi:nicotinamide riboside kinase